MIEQKAIYEAAQTAFEAHHPKFPFPKKNNLDEQTDDFKRAFLAFSADINAMHDREMNSVNSEVTAAREVIVQKINEVSTARENARVANRRADKVESKLFSAQASAFIGWTAAVVLGIALIVFKLNS